MSIVLLGNPQETMTGAGGRIILPNYKDGHFLMSATLDPNEEVPEEVEYQTGPVQDQGRNPWCTAYAWNDFLLAEPTPITNGPDVETLYCQEQLIDGIAGMHDGSTVRAGAQVLQNMGIIDGSYVWGYSVSTIKQYILTRGPVVFGTSWYKSFYRPDANGVVSLGGGNDGGHAYLCCGYSSSKDLFKFQNSWGVNWGADGFFYMNSQTVDLLLKDFGECCSAKSVKTN